jgi:hypothetical protein
VDSYLREHPDIAERVRQASQDLSHDPFGALPPAIPPPDLELRSLRRTMRLLAWQHRLFALALWLTGISLMAVISLQHGHPHIHFLMADYPAQLGACAQLGVTCWIYYFVIRYRLRTKPKTEPKTGTA